MALCRVGKPMQWNTGQFILIFIQAASVGKAGEKKSSSYDPSLTLDGCVQFKASKVINRFGSSFSLPWVVLQCVFGVDHLEQEAKDTLWCSPRVNSQTPHRRLWQDSQYAQTSIESGFILRPRLSWRIR